MNSADSNHSNHSSTHTPADAAVVEALKLLGKRRIALAIHDSSFPAAPGSDVGRGSPCNEGGRAFLAFARSLGFDSIQLGPQGQTPRNNPSPYDGTLFSRNLLNLDLNALASNNEENGVEGGWLSRETLDRLVQECPASDGLYSNHTYAFDACHMALNEIYQNFARKRKHGDVVAIALDAELSAFAKKHQDWLQTDALYHALAAEQGGRQYPDWTVNEDVVCTDLNLYPRRPEQDSLCEARRAALMQRHQRAIERYQLGQFLLHRQHGELHSTVNSWGLRLYGDLQVGLSPCDNWSRSRYFLERYRMGAPPSRTNPLGQPWGYGVLDPDQYLTEQATAGPALQFLSARVSKMQNGYDGLRIDHPHGLVCPWVYRNDIVDPYFAVQNGARLFSSPELPDHPELARYAITRVDQINTDVPRYADDRVRVLQSAQVDRYALLMDTVVNVVQKHGGSHEDVLCEVLSTMPYPLARAIERQGLGRFRVTQKADLDNPDDVYRSENARPEDWIMVGNHDTPSIWRLAREWRADGKARKQADYLAARLVAEPRRESFAQALADDPRKLVHAKLADIFASPAEQVMVFFADLLGIEEIYNRPGIVDPENWNLRVPPDYAVHYQHTRARGEALDLHCVLALALQARGEAFAREHRELLERLLPAGSWWADALVE